MSAYDAIKERLLTFITTSAGKATTESSDFESLALELFKFQYENNPTYQKFCREQLKDRSPESWTDIPALPLPAFRHAEVLSFPREKITRTFRTSGTTGDSYGQHFFADLELYQAAALTGWRHAGLPEKNVFGLLPSPQEAPHSSLACMAGWLCKDNPFFLKENEIDLDYLRQTCEQTDAPLCLFGTALAFLNLFELLEKNNTDLSLPPESLAVETGGFKGSGRQIEKSVLYAKFTHFLGLPADDIRNEYGMTELSSQAYTQGLGRPHKCPPWLRAQVVHPSTGREVNDGQTGVLKITDLANIGSVLAIQTRDLAIRHEKNFELIGRDPAALPRGCSRSADEVLNQGLLG
ncbi:MAG: acyl-protein synthetase [Chthoniobacterales bacterium]